MSRKLIRNQPLNLYEYSSVELLGLCKVENWRNSGEISIGMALAPFQGDQEGSGGSLEKQKGVKNVQGI